MELRHFHDAMDDALDSVKLDEDRLVLVAVSSLVAVSLQSFLQPFIGKQHLGPGLLLWRDSGWMQAHCGGRKSDQLHTSKGGAKAVPDQSSIFASIDPT